MAWRLEKRKAAGRNKLLPRQGYGTQQNAKFADSKINRILEN